jgi:hypothetical protein
MRRELIAPSESTQTVIGEKSPFQCAGLNRHEAEEEEASRERTSDPLDPEFCVRHREVHDEA